MEVVKEGSGLDPDLDKERARFHLSLSDRSMKNVFVGKKKEGGQCLGPLLAKTLLLIKRK